MDPRVAASAEALPDERPEIHNVDVDEATAALGACGQVHLPTGRTCTLKRRHSGSCDFTGRDGVRASVAEHRADDGW
jgi:hypothetical protein